MRAHIVMALLSAFSLSVNADNASQGQAFYNEVQNAKNSVSQSLNNPTLKNFNAEEYCKDQACIDEMRNPSQQAYFGNDAKLEADGQQGLITDPNAANIKEGFSSRPQYDLNPNDPALVDAKRYIDNSYAISHGISNKYIDCEGGEVCEYIDTTRQCMEPTGKTVSCQHIAIVTGEKTERYHHTTSISGIFGETQQVNFLSPAHNALIDKLTFNTSKSFSFYYNSTQLRLGVSINGTIIHQLTLTSSNNMFYLPPVIPVNQRLPKNNTLSFTLSGSNIIKPFFIPNDVNLTAEGQRRTVTMGWQNDCPVMPRECQQQSQVCVEGAGTRIINGVEVYMDCWRKTNSYTCQYPNTCTPLLNPAKASTGSQLTCDVDNRRCKVSLLGQCLVYDVALHCEEQRCESKNLMCGESFFCIDGDCYDAESEKNDEFSESASSLAALGEAAEDITADNLLIFSGKPAFCDKKPIGLSDCCADSGWGNDIGLTECSTEEKGLAKAKEKKLTIELGEYCAEEVLGVCIRKKKSYCQFDSMMGRIVQEQGKKQLNISFGSKENPDCTGITPEQMQLLDFSQIDFSDFYADLESGMELPDMKEVQDRIKDKYGDKQ